MCVNLSGVWADLVRTMRVGAGRVHTADTVYPAVNHSARSGVTPLSLRHAFNKEGARLTHNVHGGASLRDVSFVYFTLHNVGYVPDCHYYYQLISASNGSDMSL